jgi:hypothetical protein
MASRRMRDTGIWETPMRSAISRWRRSSSNRMRSTARARVSSVLTTSSASNRSVDGSEPAVRLGQEVKSGWALVALARRCVERQRALALGGREPLHDLLVSAVERRSDLAHGRLAPVRAPEPLARPDDLQGEVLQRSRRLDDPGAVAEVAAEFTEDRRDRVAGEHGAAVGIPSGDRLDQAEAATCTRSSIGSGVCR